MYPPSALIRCTSEPQMAQWDTRTSTPLGPSGAAVKECRSSLDLGEKDAQHWMVRSAMVLVRAGRSAQHFPADPPVLKEAPRWATGG